MYVDSKYVESNWYFFIKISLYSCVYLNVIFWNIRIFEIKRVEECSKGKRYFVIIIVD